MKHFAVLLQLSLAMIVTAIFFACSPIPDKTQQNDFFTPVNRIENKKVGSDTLDITLESDHTNVHDSLKDSLIVLFRQQNKRLNDMVQQLNLLTKKNNIGNSKDTDNFDDISINRNHLSNEMLLEKIKNQNQRLNDVIEQLRLLSENQQNQSENHDHLITSANVVPVQPTPAQKVSVPLHPNTSLNYEKAIQLYKSRQYGNAIGVFKKLLIQKIEPKLADRYHFWMGVCYINLNKSNQAIKEFTNVLGYTHSEKAEEAYFMIGQCYERIGAKKSAKMTYEKMLRIYPQGNLKLVAEKKLALLK
ncbi:MAG: tetratricopeptide repeat protein [Bacteroidota bacterium]|jgi:TolA-binding protein